MENEVVILKGRCATCKYWGGNSDLVFQQVREILSEKFDLEAFLNVEDSWSYTGSCYKLTMLDCFGDVDGVFGCVMYEEMEEK